MNPYFADESVTLWHGDSLAVMRDLPDQSVDCCVTSPPYFGLRDYCVQGQYGLEASPFEYVETMRALFAEVRRVLADDGTLWLNIGDSYSGSIGYATGEAAATSSTLGGRKQQAIVAPGRKSRRRDAAPVAGPRNLSGGGLPAKNLLGIPWRTAFALQDDGWILRNEIIWSKPNAMPGSVADRLSSRHEHLFMLSKSPRYWFNLDPIREATGSNPGDVWAIPTQPFSAAHFAVYPIALPERAILAGCKPGGTVLDPFSGSGTTGLAATKHGRKYVGIDLSSDYLDLSLRTRFAQPGLDLTGGAA